MYFGLHFQFKKLTFKNKTLQNKNKKKQVAHSIGVGRFRILGGGVGARFRILGGQGLEYWGGQGGGPKSQQAPDVEMTSMRRNDVAPTSFRRQVPTRFLINQC